MEINKVKLIGTLELTQEGYIIKVPRYSGAEDRIRVRTRQDYSELVGKNVELIEAHIRTNRNNKKLLVYVVAEDIIESDKPTKNEVEIDATVVKNPIYRVTPKGRKIVELLIANNYNESNYLPIIGWGKIAIEYSFVEIGTKLNIKGRIQSREYQNQKEEKHTTYEISAQEVITYEND